MKDILMFAWAKVSDSHGLVYKNIFWLPEGDVPEVPGKYVKVLTLTMSTHEVQEIII